MLRLARVFREFGFHLIDELGRSDAASAMNGAQPRRPGLRFADSPAASMVPDSIDTVRAETADGEMTERIANIAFRVDCWDIERDRDRHREQQMITGQRGK